MKLLLTHLTSPSPSWHFPVLLPSSTHPLRPPDPDEYRYSMLLRYRYAPSDTGASLDSYRTSPYCCSKCDGRHGGDIRHLNLASVVVSFYHRVKPMLPMHRHLAGSAGSRNGQGAGSQGRWKSRRTRIAAACPPGGFHRGFYRPPSGG